MDRCCKGFKMKNKINRRHFLKLTAAISTSPFALNSLAATTPKPTNVLFIAVDDLRCQLGCYGQKQIKSPNIDRLAAAGTLFERAYCQQAVCSPSRTSIITGLRPDSTKVWDLETYFRDTIPDVITLPQHFKNNGYHTESIGKIAHNKLMQDDKLSWSVPSIRPHANGSWQTDENIAIRNKLIKDARAKGLKGKPFRYATLGPATDNADTPDTDWPDGLTAKLTIESLQKLAKKDKPFFLAAGFVKPHLPFSAPKKYWDLYDPEKIEIPTQTDWPENMPPLASSNWGELRHYHSMPAKGKLTDAQTRHLIHGYYACVSFVDAQIGKLLDALKSLNLADNTVIILWGDHGWKLGDYGAWCKHTNFELDTHAPLILSAPGCKQNQKSPALVEFVDIYPTLAHLCSLSIPDHCQGSSLVPLLKEPNKKWKPAAFSQYPRPKAMGYSIRTNDFRYTEWTQRRTGKTIARELYDHRTSSTASTNLADNPKHSDTIAKLSKILNKGTGWEKFIDQH